MGDFTIYDVLTAADELIYIRQRLVKALKEWLSEIGKNDVKLKACKTVFPVYTILGTIALFTPAAPLAPFLIGGGVFGSVVSSIVDYKASNSIQTQLYDLLNKERPYADKLEDMLRRLEKYKNEMAASHSMDYDTAAKLVAAKFALGGFKGVVYMAERGTVPTAKAAGKVITKIATSQKVVGATVVKVMAKQGVQNAGKVFKKALGPISIALDVADIIYTWSSDPPGVKDVKEVIGKLESGIERVNKVKLMFFPA